MGEAGTEVGRKGNGEILSSVHSSLPRIPGKVTGGLCRWKEEISGKSLAAQESQGSVRVMLS